MIYIQTAVIYYKAIECGVVQIKIVPAVLDIFKDKPNAYCWDNLIMFKLFSIKFDEE